MYRLAYHLDYHYTAVRTLSKNTYTFVHVQHQVSRCLDLALAREILGKNLNFDPDIEYQTDLRN